MKDKPAYDTYHLSSGTGSQTFRELTTALAQAQNTRKPIFLPVMEGPFTASVNMLANRQGGLGHGASLMKVFLPYLTWNTVFDNTRVTTELGRKPVPFSQYSFPLLRFSRQHNFTYPYQEWPTTAKAGGSAGMMDFVLEAWVSGIIEGKKVQWMMGKGEPWKPGEKLKLLFAGYNGTRNTGSDVRVEEMLRQVRRILGPEHVDLTMMTFNFDRSRGYFEGTSQVRLPDIFPPFLSNEVPKHHGVVACEGSMFKSKFANALATMMIGSLGIAAAENKLVGRLRCRSRSDGSAGREDVRTIL